MLLVQNIGRRLRQLREAANISQEALGKRLGRNQRWVSQRELGQVKVGPDELEEIARALGYSAAVIIEQQADELIQALRTADPDEISLAASFLRALPYMERGERDMIAAMLEVVSNRRQQSEVS